MPFDVAKQVAYWRSSAEEDWEVGCDLVNRGKSRHGLFFIHLALEKVLKAHVCKTTNDFAPKIHLLPRLAELSDLTFTSEQSDFLAVLNRFCLAGRYPSVHEKPPSKNRAREFVQTAERLKIWLTSQL